MVPSWRDAHEVPPAPLLAALQRAHRRGAIVVGLCLGAFALAAAGLLDGRPATTHWRWSGLFAQRYPAVQVDPGVLYVDAGDVLTSAGTAAGIDCCLHLVRRELGSEVTNKIARRMVVPPQRDGGQRQFDFRWCGGLAADAPVRGPEARPQALGRDSWACSVC